MLLVAGFAKWIWLWQACLAIEGCGRFGPWTPQQGTPNGSFEPGLSTARAGVAQQTWNNRVAYLEEKDFCNSISCNFCWVTGSNFTLCFQALLDLVWPFGKYVRFFSPPSCTHSCAVAERSKEKWMDLINLGGGALRNLFGGFNRSRFLLLIVLFQNK